MITWPRVRIVFFWIGMFSALLYGYEALGIALNTIMEFIEWVRTLSA